MQQKKVALDLRGFLDVAEGVRTLVYGRPKVIPQAKLGLYLTYASSKQKDGDLAGL